MTMIKSIITMGFGSYSTVNYIPTLGFSIGAVTDVTAEGRDFVLSGPRPIYIPRLYRGTNT